MITLLEIFEILIVVVTLLYVLINDYIIIFGAPYAPSTDHRIKEICDLLKIKPGDVTCDLGSGNGSIVIEMAKRGAQLKIFGLQIFQILMLSLCI